MIRGYFDIVCYDPGGWVAWRQRLPNLWTTEGMNDVLNQYFGGTALSAVYMGLISSVSYAAGPVAGDTAAQILGNNTGTNGWAEACNGTFLPTYSELTRPAVTFGAAASGGRSTSAVSVFTVTANGTIKGAFLITDNTIGGQLGKLLNGALFVGGDQAVTAGQIINANYSVNM